MSHSSRGITRFQITLPATSANLGPAFDAAALAFSLFLKVSAKPAERFSVTARGRDADICQRIENHLILTTYRDILHGQGKPIVPLALQIENQIPIGKGCGSSAAARLAGIALANHIGRLHWTAARIVGEAACREHHPDNATACWMGGLAIARMSAKRETQMIRIVPKGKWPLLLAVPGEALSTEEARRVLPDQYARADVVANIQNAMLLLAGFSQGRRDLLSGALVDRVHQPYRSRLCPLLPALQPLTGSKGILGVALSGAGPSVLIFLGPQENFASVRKRVATHLRNQNLRADLIETAITNSGASSSMRAVR
ncbi:MAG TPA: homoserine kinase [Terriglobales bacterium]|nr:homoserine kinase [Terriglobales bacterium]